MNCFLDTDRGLVLQEWKSYTKFKELFILHKIYIEIYMFDNFIKLFWCKINNYKFNTTH